MSYIAIGSVRETNGIIGIRLLDPDNMSMKDIPLSDIDYYSNRNGGICNINKDKRGKIHWKQGAADRYPIIDKLTNTVQNKESVIILGVATSNLQKYYKICNYLGQTTTIQNASLVEYGKKYKLANGKVVKKQGTEFISAIEGQLPEIDTQVQYKFKHDLHYMEINMPFINKPEIEIAETTPDGKLIMDIRSIEVKPASSALAIKKITLSKYIKNIRYGLFSSLPNLEEVVIKASDAALWDTAFIGLKRLKRVTIEGVSAVGMSVFEGLDQLEKVEFTQPIKYINSGMFKGCKSLDISGIISEGTIAIGTKAFFNNKKIERLVLPSSIREIKHNSFEGCSNLKEIYCKTEVIDISSGGRYQDKKFLDNMQPIILYCSRHLIIDGKLGPNVKVVYYEDGERERKIDKKIVKSNLMGMKLSASEVIRGANDIADAIVACSQTEVTNMMMDLTNQLLTNDRAYYSNGTYDLGGFKVNLSMRTVNGMSKAKKIKMQGKFIVLMGPNIIFIPCDQIILKHYLKNFGHYNLYIEPAYAKSKYIKSIDISDTGLIRLIYQKPSGEVASITIKKFQIDEDN